MNHESFCSAEVGELAKAMIEVQRSLPAAQKDRENEFTRSRYATLNSVVDTCRDVLLRHGVWAVQHPVPAGEGSLGLVTRLVHAESGQWQSSVMVMIMIMTLPKSDPQGYGSALTYARRYALSTLVGLVTELDDDAQGAMPNRPGNGRAAFDLPRLDGVKYHCVPAQDGRECITATGDTRSKREMLKEAGFRWDPDKKIWWQYAERAA